MRTGSLRARTILLILLCLGGAGLASLISFRPPLPNDGGLVFAPSEDVAGATLGEWSARHWEWTLSQPIGANPGQDVTGATCGLEQEGPVFFLPRNFAPCRVPMNTLILVPIVGTECSTVEPPPYHGMNEQELRTCASRDVNRYTNITVRIDGQPVPDAAAFRRESPAFTVTLPEHNVLGVPAGDAEVVSDGYQMLLAPLPLGTHHIVVHVELTDGTVLPDKVIAITVVGSTD